MQVNKKIYSKQARNTKGKQTWIPFDKWKSLKCLVTHDNLRINLSTGVDSAIRKVIVAKQHSRQKLQASTIQKSIFWRSQILRLNYLCISKIKALTYPSRAYPGHLKPLPSRVCGIWSLWSRLDFMLHAPMIEPGFIKRDGGLHGEFWGF